MFMIYYFNISVEHDHSIDMNNHRRGNIVNPSWYVGID